MDTIHLICNAHLDPVWQWEWEEGAAEAVSTFRVAADFCEEFDRFIFCHNEVVLYEWVEEYEPHLFKRIQKLVKKGKWHIMGGWYRRKTDGPFIFPCGEGKKNGKLIELSNNIIQMTAMKKAGKSDDLIIRLFEPTGNASKTMLYIPLAKIRKNISLAPFEILTLKINLKNNTITETTIDEQEK